MKRLGALLASLLLAGSLTACGGTAAQEMQSIQVFAMDTVMGLRACGGETEAALAAAEDEIYRMPEHKRVATGFLPGGSSSMQDTDRSP